jgi:hypothetical protein
VGGDRLVTLAPDAVSDDGRHLMSCFEQFRCLLARTKPVLHSEMADLLTEAVPFGELERELSLIDELGLGARPPLAAGVEFAPLAAGR